MRTATRSDAADKEVRCDERRILLISQVSNAQLVQERLQPTTCALPRRSIPVTAPRFSLGVSAGQALKSRPDSTGSEPHSERRLPSALCHVASSKPETTEDCSARDCRAGVVGSPQLVASASPAAGELAGTAAPERRRALATQQGPGAPRPPSVRRRQAYEVGWDRYAQGVTSTMTLQALRARRDEILDAARRRHARNVRVFGSVARGDQGPGSDVDFLVDFDPEASLLDQVGLIQELQGVLGVDVDVVSSGGLRPRHDAIRREAVAL